MRRARQGIIVLLAGVALAGCGVQYRARQQFSGNMTSSSIACPPQTATLIVQADKVAFSPGDGAWVVPGDLNGASIRAEKSRPGVDRKLYSTRLEATIQGEVATGTYTTPTCSYQVNLSRY